MDQSSVILKLTGWMNITVTDYPLTNQITCLKSEPMTESICRDPYFQVPKANKVTTELTPNKLLGWDNEHQIPSQ